MTKIPDFTDTELWVIRTTLKERYGYEPALQPADAELRIPPATRELTLVPAMFWAEQGANFVISRLDEKSYRPQFFIVATSSMAAGARRMTKSPNTSPVSCRFRPIMHANPPWGRKVRIRAAGTMTTSNIHI